MPDPEFWRDRRVLVTGHTGFKGGWATRLLAKMGADITGLALAPETEPSLWRLLGAEAQPGTPASLICDLRDHAAVRRAVSEAAPELVLHMAAQPLVRRSYRDPVETFATNVMGTVNLMDALGGCDGVRAVLVVTSDKVYENDQSGRPFVEGDRLGGHDPYAASKAAAEIATACWRQAFLAERGTALASARGGNVIGGGDFSEDRLVPDIVRAALAGAPLILRHPDATRPWQHVLDCLTGYIDYLEALAKGKQAPNALNFGPALDASPLTVAEVAVAMNTALGIETPWNRDRRAGPVEMHALSVDPSAAETTLRWRNRLPPAEAIQWTAEWYSHWRAGGDMCQFTDDQIERFAQRQGSPE